MKFTDLKFKDRQGLPGIHVIVFFPNGYGASIVKGDGTYGAEDGLYELAVLQGSLDSWHICYETPLTSDVLGYLKPNDVTGHLVAIEELPKAEARP